MATISLRLEDRDDELIRAYAKLNNISISQLIKNAVIEKIENEIDLKAFDFALQNMKKTYTQEEAEKILGLQN